MEKLGALEIGLKYSHLVGFELKNTSKTKSYYLLKLTIEIGLKDIYLVGFELKSTSKTNSYDYLKLTTERFFSRYHSVKVLT